MWIVFIYVGISIFLYSITVFVSFNNCAHISIKNYGTKRIEFA